MMEVAEELKGSAEHIRYVFTSCCQTLENVDILLILNACEAACAAQPEFEGPVITATPQTIDHWSVESELLVQTIKEVLIRTEDSRDPFDKSV